VPRYVTYERSGFFGHGDMQKEFEEAAFGLQKGQVSDIVDTASGLHLIQRFDTRTRLWSHADGSATG
jgi:parvulin-like peptidyl-prolyl isomerase